MKKCVWMLALSATLVLAAPPKQVVMFFAPEDGGRDYAVQGEYAGTCGDAKLAAQLAALGKDQWAVSMLPGGLPGDGWDNKTRSEGTAKLEGEKITFTAKAYTGELVGDTLKGTVDGKEFSLKKVARKSPTLGLKAPDGATVLLGLDKNPDLSQWNGAQVHEKSGWFATEPKQPVSKFKHRSASLHIEFMQPFEPFERGQGRGNSGVYLAGHYEIQVVDSFGFFGGLGKPKGDICGDVYSKSAALTNAIFPPLTWNTYDIDYTAPKFEDGKKVADGVVTVKLNGIMIHDNVKLSGVTPGGIDAKESADPTALMLQSHHHPILFRNVWVLEKK